jgi:hypothetical protein
MRIGLVVLAACGSAAAPVAAPPQPAKPVPQPVSCGDAGVILRGDVNDTKRAGPAKEAAIASACLHDKWPQEILTCIGQEPTAPVTCLETLTEAQLEGYGKDMRAWATLFNEVAEGFEVPPALAVECAAGIGDVAAYSPILTVTGEDRVFAVDLRRQAISALCLDGWAEEVRRCFADGQAIDACRQRLRPHERQAVIDKLVETDQVVARIVAAKKLPAASYDCAHVALAYYSDAAWKGKAELKPVNASAAERRKLAAERAKMIADSRAKLTSVCTTDGWSATIRACVVGGASEACLPMPELWGFPPGGVVPNTGIVECDAYGAMLTRLLACKTFPQQARDAIKQSFEQQRQVWLNARPDQKQAIGSSCAQAEQAMRQAAASAGCTI